MFKLRIKMNASQDTVEVTTDGGKMVVDRSEMSKVQRDELARLVTDAWVAVRDS